MLPIPHEKPPSDRFQSVLLVICSLAVLCLLALAEASHGAEPPPAAHSTGQSPADPAAATVQIRHSFQQCGTSRCSIVTGIGSGTIIGTIGDNHREYVALTARHVVQESNARTLIGAGGRWYPANHLSRHDSLDAALVSFVADQDLPIAAIEPAGAAVADRVDRYGFANGDRFRSASGAVQEVAGEYVRLTGYAIDGESGGGFFVRGRLCGVVFGTGVQHQACYATPIGPICSWMQRQRFAVRFCGPLPSSPQVAAKPLPPAPPTVQPPTLPQQPQQPGLPIDLKPIASALEQINARLAVLESRPSIPGPAGPAGPRGERGDPGPAGTLPDSSGELAAFKQRLEKLESTKIPLHILNPDGSLKLAKTVKLGEPIPLRLLPSEE